jgi:hypothetical protein
MIKTNTIQTQTWRLYMNRYIAPIALVLALTVTSVAQAAPKQTQPDFGNSYFAERTAPGH